MHDCYTAVKAVPVSKRRVGETVTHAHAVPCDTQNGHTLGAHDVDVDEASMRSRCSMFKLVVNVNVHAFMQTPTQSQRGGCGGDNGPRTEN